MISSEHRLSPARFRALRAIAQAAARSGIGNSLPPVAQLAAEAGCSHVTMLRVLHELARQGVVSISQGLPARVCKLIPMPAEPPVLVSPVSERIPRWLQIVRAIEQHALGATQGAEHLLPPIRGLAQKYGVSVPTIRKAVRYLAATGRLRSERRCWRVLSYRPEYNGVIALVAPSTDGIRITPPNVRSIELCRSLLASTVAASVSLVFYPFEPWNGVLYHHGVPVQEVPTTYRNNPVLGVVFLPCGMPRAERVVAFMSSMVPRSVPMVMVDEAVGTPWPTWVAGSAVRIVLRFVQGELEGLRMGRLLIDYGHRHVLWISPYHGAQWSRGRMHGLRKAFEIAGIDNGVHAVIDEHYRDATCYLNEHLSRAERTRTTVEHTLLSRGRDEPLLKGILDILRAAVPNALFAATLELLCQPLFEEAVKHRGATAWVCANDEVALCAMAFLRARGIRVPQDISVTGFDDTNVALLEGLTSYNFNAPQLAAVLIDRLLHPPQYSRVVAEDFDGGFVTVRETLMRVRSSPVAATKR